MKESKIVEEVIGRINRAELYFQTEKKPYRIRAFRPKVEVGIYDIEIRIGLTVYGIIKILEEISWVQSEHKVQSAIEKFAIANDIRFAIATNGQVYTISDIRLGAQDVGVSFQYLAETLQRSPTKNSKILIYNVAQVIADSLTESGLHELPGMNQFVERLGTKLSYDEIRDSISFKDPKAVENPENEFFTLLLDGAEKLEKIYRYTTKETLFAMLTKNSFRMNCLIGMNDTSEVDYAEDYLLGKKTDYALAPWQRVDALNRRFISSCSLKSDDLTQWRLYADDSRGVCMEFRLHDVAANPDFLVRKISYGNADGSHTILDTLKSIILNSRGRFDVGFRFRWLSTWRHFFKPSEYAVEEEVRVLYVLKRGASKSGWFITHSHGILNPYIDFDLNFKDLPVHLTEIVLGSKCAEQVTNLKQFQQLIRDVRKDPNYNIDDLQVKVSGITSYR